MSNQSKMELDAGEGSPSPKAFANFGRELEQLAKRELHRPLRDLVEAAEREYENGRKVFGSKRDSLSKLRRELDEQERQLNREEESHDQTSRRTFRDACGGIVQQLGRRIREEIAWRYVDEELRLIMAPALAGILMGMDNLQGEIPRPSIEPPDFAATEQGEDHRVGGGKMRDTNSVGLHRFGNASLPVC